MFLGHFALAFGAKRAEPETSLWTLFVAAQLPDLVWPVLVLAGAERVAIAPGDTAVTPLRFESYPISHSLLTVALWGVALALLHWWRERRPAASFVLWALVVSHWLLDFVSHRPDMPLAPGSPRLYGLGLWDSVAGTVVVEGLMYAAGLALYLNATRAPDAVGRWGFFALAAVLVLLYVASLVSPPPPSPQAVAVAGSLGGVLFAAWAVWVDRHRVPRARWTFDWMD